MLHVWQQLGKQADLQRKNKPEDKKLLIAALSSESKRLEVKKKKQTNKANMRLAGFSSASPPDLMT